MEFASNGDVESVSSYKSQLYDNSSEDNFFDCNSEFCDKVSHLEREHFDALHLDNADNNATFSTSEERRSQENFLKGFREGKLSCP